MSRRTQRAVALLLLHQQAMGSGHLPTVPPTLAAVVAELVAPPRPWYVRAWRWLWNRYHLTGWEDP